MAPARREHGFTLIEALVALGIVSMIVISFIGIRTTALVDATRARNWRLAREIAEETMSVLRAGARETPPVSGEPVSLEEKYPGFSYKIVIGEGAVADLESQIASEAAAGDETVTERNDWQRNREDFRRAQSRGLSATQYTEQQLADQQEAALRLQTEAPSATKFEVVAVAVYFPKLDPDFEGQQESLVIKARLSTLALSGRTPEEAERLAQANGEAGAAGGNPGGAAPGGGGSGGGGAGAMSEAGGR
jgi:prepilin-type N-terminal cleavage/methylation domain-containing protein